MRSPLSLQLPMRTLYLSLYVCRGKNNRTSAPKIFMDMMGGRGEEEGEDDGEQEEQL